MLLMQKPRMITGAAEMTCMAYAPSLEMINERLITSIIPFGHGWKTDPPLFGTHLHFKNIFWYMFFCGCSGGYPIGCSNGIRRGRNRVHSLRDAGARGYAALERVDMLADYTQMALADGEVADAVEMVGDMREIIFLAVAPYR